MKEIITMCKMYVDILIHGENSKMLTQDNLELVMNKEDASKLSEAISTLRQLEKKL